MPKGILLFSDGLDSLLSGLLVKNLGVEVIALRLITPFFGWDYQKNPEKFYEKVKTYGFSKGYLLNITHDFLKILKKPAYGYGKYANPCVDCKVLMFKKAREVLEKERADFIISGEVVGQRPFSQNKPAIELIEKKAGVKGLVVRPLCAKYLSPSTAEVSGIIPREKLLAIRGRKRTPQIELAKKLGVKNIPSPSGGCLLTDPQIGERVLKVIKENRTLNEITAEILCFGRHLFEEGLWIVLGRNKEENERLEGLCKGRFTLYRLSVPSPTLAVIEGFLSKDSARNLLVRYSNKAKRVLEKGGTVECIKL